MPLEQVRITPSPALNKEFFVPCQDITMLSEQEKQWVSLFNGSFKASQGKDDLMFFTYFHCWLPIAPPEQMLEYATEECKKTQDICNELGQNIWYVSIFDWITRKFFLEKMMDAVRRYDWRYSFEDEKLYWVLEDLYYHYFDRKSKQRKYRLENLTGFKLSLFYSFERHIVKVRYDFYRKCCNILREKISPSYPNHRPPQTVNEWMQRIEQIREEYANAKTDF